MRLRHQPGDAITLFNGSGGNSTVFSRLADVGLEYLRQVMDGIDAEIIDLIARRMELSEKIGLVKKECNLTAYQPERWNEIVETRGQRAEKAGISRQFIVELYEKIHHHSISKQLEILQGLIKELKS